MDIIIRETILRALAPNAIRTEVDYKADIGGEIFRTVNNLEEGSDFRHYKDESFALSICAAVQEFQCFRESLRPSLIFVRRSRDFRDQQS